MENREQVLEISFNSLESNTIQVGADGIPINGLTLLISLKTKPPKKLHFSPSAEVSLQTFTFWIGAKDFHLPSDLSIANWSFKQLDYTREGHPIAKRFYFLARKEFLINDKKPVKIDFDDSYFLDENGRFRPREDTLTYNYLLKDETFDRHSFNEIFFTFNFKTVRPFPKLPLVPTIHGSLLNNNKPQSLKIYLINNGTKPIKLDESTIYFAYYANGACQRPDALTSSTEDPKVDFIDLQDATSGTFEGGPNDEVARKPPLVFKDKTLQVGQSIGIKVEELKTNLPARIGNFYLTFQNVPDYADTQFIIPVQISPIYISREENKLQDLININGNTEFKGIAQFLNTASQNQCYANFEVPILANKLSLFNRISFVTKLGESYQNDVKVDFGHFKLLNINVYVFIPHQFPFSVSYALKNVEDHSFKINFFEKKNYSNWIEYECYLRDKKLKFNYSAGQLSELLKKCSAQITIAQVHNNLINTE